METVTGRIVFRNRMGSSNIIKVEDDTGSLHSLHFREEDLGDAKYAEVRAFDLGDELTADVVPSTRTWRTPNVLDAVSFSRV